MDDVSSQPALNCTQCGAELDVPEGEVFFPCAHCSSALYLDKSRVVLHYVVSRTLEAEAAERTLRRWMAGSETAKDLDREAEIGEPVLRYFPMWRFTVREGGGESAYVTPAAAATLGLLERLTLPPGELRFYDPRTDAHLIRPTVPYDRASERSVVREASLVHMPLYFFEYRYQGRIYRAAVDGSSGEVFSETYPTRRDLPFRITATIAFVVFFVVAFVAYLIEPWPTGGTEYVYALRCGVQLLAAVPLFFLARYVACRM